MSASSTLGYEHIYPLGDLKEHVLDGLDCWCRPVIDDADMTVLHNSLDRRELYEKSVH